MQRFDAALAWISQGNRKETPDMRRQRATHCGPSPVPRVRIVHTPPARDEPVYWIGDVPTTCDICYAKIRKHFADAKTKEGPWGNLDLKCLRVHGVGTGKGKGQLYRLQDDGRWLKIEG